MTDAQRIEASWRELGAQEVPGAVAARGSPCTRSHTKRPARPAQHTHQQEGGAFPERRKSLSEHTKEAASPAADGSFPQKAKRQRFHLHLHKACEEDTGARTQTGPWPCSRDPEGTRDAVTESRKPAPTAGLVLRTQGSRRGRHRPGRGGLSARHGLGGNGASHFRHAQIHHSKVILKI